jgi:hypothetical protein
VIGGIAANALEAETVDVTAIDMTNALQDVPAALVSGGKRKLRGPRRVDREGTRIRYQPFVGMDLDV